MLDAVSMVVCQQNWHMSECPVQMTEVGSAGSKGGHIPQLHTAIRRPVIVSRGVRILVGSLLT